jgi:phosphoribosyl 1,2-cyclic phosphodiesterase
LPDKGVAMKLLIHGCRGSVPSPSKQTVKYGGNTPCFEIQIGDMQLFFDTGTGFRTANIMADTSKVLCFYSHFHHDHIQGLPFNPTLFNNAVDFTFTSGLIDKDSLKHTLKTYFSGGYFPLDIVTFLENLAFANIADVIESLKETVKIDWIELNHPGGSIGYSVQAGQHKFVYLLDNEYQPEQRDALAAFCAGADIVAWDGMFTDAELPAKKGWGHSSMEQALSVKQSANISTMIIAHHNPSRTDEQLDILADSFSAENLHFAQDGLTYDFRSGIFK